MKIEKRVLVAVSMACIALGLQAVGCAEAGPAAPSVTVAPAETSDITVPASPETTAEHGATKWGIHSELDGSFRVYGLDAHDTVVAEMQLRPELDDQGEVLGVTVESGFPEQGSITLRPDGLIEAEARDGDGAPSPVFQAMVSDFQAFDEGPGPQPQSVWGCIKATVKMVAVCGAAIVVCVKGGGGIDCVTGGGACLAAVQNFLCKCKHKC